MIATGQCHSVRDFVDAAFSCVGLDYRAYVVVDPTLYRPAEVELLMGDASKAKEQLGWAPKTALHELVDEMVECDCKRYRVAKAAKISA